MVYDLNTRTSLGSMADWVCDTYGIIIPESGFISYVSPDGKHVHGSMPMASAGGVTYVSWYIRTAHSQVIKCIIRLKAAAFR